jgi:hypothetical protein
VGDEDVLKITWNPSASGYFKSSQERPFKNAQIEELARNLSIVGYL